jgi:uncharacterized protein YndB with AHSA1/START domain
MPIKKDGTGKRWVEMELLVPGTPEEVWRALATGPGTSAWFIKTEIEERVGGAVRFHFAPDLVQQGEVTAWERPHRFAYVERDWAEGAPPVATEITIKGRSGGQCVVRMVHSLFSSTDDWDGQMEGFESGWPGFFDVLRVYLAHFAGQPAATFHAMADAPGKDIEVWTRLLEPLGLAGANVGEHRTATSAPERLSGLVDRVNQDAKQRYLVLRVEEPAPGVALIGMYRKDQGAAVSVLRFFYGESAGDRAAEAEPRWRSWLEQTFAGIKA